MQALPVTSQAFTQDQQLSWTVEYWDTPFATLENEVASNGIPFWLREPTAAGVFDPSVLKGTITQATAETEFNVLGKAVVTDGRVPNLLGYWAGGAPGMHGATFDRRVAYRLKAHLRSTTGRAWFDAATNPTFTLAFAGNGYLKIFKVVSGTPTLLYNDKIREEDFLVPGSGGGFKFTATVTNMAAGDFLDIYYIQDSELWGGFVVKAVQGTLPSTEAAKQAAARDAPVLGCGLFDDNAPPVKRTITMFQSATVEQSIGSSAKASFDLPLINPAVNDGVGWEWSRVDANDPGVLRSREPLVASFDLKRQRLVRVKGGFQGEEYVLFTGFIDDWQEPNNGVVPVRCLGFEQRLLDQFNKNYPDKVSYMAFGYRNRSGTSEPVYEIPAYDNWPIEFVLRDLLVRAGVDESKTFRNLTVPKSDGTAATVTYGSETYRKFRARTLVGNQLKLERPVHYGNSGVAFNELKPADDEYIFKPENMKELWARCREIVDRYGYDFRFDEFGDAWLQSRNNPHAVTDLGAAAGGTAKTHPSAYAGTYRQYTGAVVLFTTQVKGARIDLSVPRGPSHGSWTFTVKRASDSGVMATGTINPDSGASGPEEFFYDFRAAVDGTNSTVATLFSGDFDTYNVELSSSGGAGGTVRRLDAFLLYHTDPAKPRFPQSLSTAVNALGVQSRPTMDEMRNYVLVVGRRRAVVTDSAKLDTNPNNPEGEFVVERAVDVGSVVDPAAKNYIGFTKESIIFDSGVTDQDFAAYLARTFIYRQRVPKPIASVEHTLLPVLQLRDPVFAVEEGFQTIDAQTVLYVTSLRHTYDGARAVTQVETTSFPEFPAYEPREDIDIDANFGGSPVTNIDVSYTSLTGQAKSNLGTMFGGNPTVHVSQDIDDLNLLGGGNLFNNSSFEVDSDGNGVADNWNLYNNGPEGAIPTIGADPYHGAKSQKVTWSVTNTSTKGVFRNAPVGGWKANTWYVISVWAKCTVATQLQLYWNNAPNDQILIAQPTLDGTYRRTVWNIRWTTNPIDPRLFCSIIAAGSQAAGTVTFDAFMAQEGQILTEYEQDASVGKEFTGVAIQAGTPKYLDMAALSAAWPPVPGTVQIKDGTSSGGIGKLSGFDQQNVFRGGEVTVKLEQMLAIGIVTVKGFDEFRDANGTNHTWSKTYTITERPADGPFYWHWEPGTELIHFVYSGTGGTQWQSVHRWEGTVNWVQRGAGESGEYRTNNPYHHYFNVDFRDGLDRKIYLPWNEGDASANYKGINALTTLDVRYRKLGPVDGTGAYIAQYPSGSPFYDPYTSEVGRLVNVKFDALVSGLYRISVRNVVDDEVVAWLTEPTAEPENDESHWQYITAGAGRSFSWDGVDQVGVWNQRQSEDYAVGAQGAFEQRERPVIGKGFYVWNEERRSGSLGPLALIADTRDVKGKPIFGQGTFAAWYVRFEVINDSLQAIADASPSSASKTVPRLVRTDAPAYSTFSAGHNPMVLKDSGTATSGTSTTITDSTKLWVTNEWKGHVVRIVAGTSAGKVGIISSNTATTLTFDPTVFPVDATSQYQIEAMGALIFTHLPEPTKVELAVADWRPTAPAFDETNEADINNPAYWGAVDETGTATSATLTTLSDSTKLWGTNLWTGYEVKITAGTGVGQVRRVTANTATELTVASAWTTIPNTTSVYQIDTLARVNNAKPVRVRFTVVPRPGTLFTGNESEVSVRLFRDVHLRATIHDMFVKYQGSNFPDSVYEDRRLVTRRLVNDEHTLRFEDDSYRKAASFKQVDGGTGTEWIFLPNHFRKDFRGRDNEPIQFGDYLQLEEVPAWDPSRPIAGMRSRYLIGFMNYLFYLSAFTQDRSGRFVWCLNRKFLDKTKLVKNAFGDWWDEAASWTGGAAPIAANSTTYRNAWPDDPVRQHRRTVLTRQWADEGTWKVDQAAKWGFAANTVGDLLLRHKWRDHDVASTTINGVLWSSLALTEDLHSKWHADGGRTELPSGFFGLIRQLGTATGTHLGLWTWEGIGENDNTRWAPCVTRDFHPYFLLPPMVDKGGGAANYFDSVSGTDTAAAEVWNSKVFDMGQVYSSSGSGLRRFFRGTVVEKSTVLHLFNYQRQDELVHYEDLRGLFSRGAKPAESPIKVTPVQPYYINPYRYSRIKTSQAAKVKVYPKYSEDVGISWFEMAFRHEYLWESGSLFPTDFAGHELLDIVNYQLGRFPVSVTRLALVRYDDGAWAGWKDDKITIDETDPNYKLHSDRANVFSGSSYLPVAVGPKLIVTRDMLFHLVLLNERRDAPLNV